MTKFLPDPNLDGPAEFFVTFYAVCHDKRPDTAAHLRRLAAMLIYRSHCTINGKVQTGFSYDSRPHVAIAYNNLLASLSLDGNQIGMFHEEVSASDGASVEELGGDQSKRRTGAKRPGAQTKVIGGYDRSAPNLAYKVPAYIDE
jgi:hypothetical protein